MKASRRVLTRHIASQLLAGKSRKEVASLLAAYVVEHKLQSQLELILADIATHLAKAGHIEATVTSAHPLDAALRKEITAYIANSEKTTDVEIREQIDPEILGGIIIETPHRRFDASIATKLKRLRNA